MSLIANDHLRNLRNEYNLLKIIHHRNKNQHHASIWWKDLNMLKRTLTKLITLLDNPRPNERQRREVLKLAMYVKCVLAKKCFWSFNGVIALAQFVTLGMTLLGLLAKVVSEIGFVEGLENAIVERKEKGLRSAESGAVDVEMGDGDDLGEEVGEVVVPEVMDLERNMAGVAEKKKSKVRRIEKNTGLDFGGVKKEQPKNKGKKTKKNKKKSAIDDIFGF